MSDLKPCPFCGGKAKLKHIKGCGYYICCNGVGCGYTHPAKSKDKAIEVWNRRIGAPLVNSEQITKSDIINSQVSDEELALINSYTRRELTKEEVYAFSVVLCDNDIDRDGERFTVESLFDLAKLFVGKTGIIDYNSSAKNQTARIFSCSVKAIQGKKTQTGDNYFRLKAKAYIVKDKHNEGVIRLIDNGTLNEVSICCSVSEIRCNICGAKKDECSHEIGKQYGYRVCYHSIINVDDAYEWRVKERVK